MAKDDFLIEETVVLIKPDGVQRAVVGDIITRFEKVGLKIAAMKMIQIGPDHARKHYPISRTEWLKIIGERALEAYKEYGRDPKEDIEDLTPIEMGKKMANWLVDYLAEGPLIAMLLRGDNAILTVRKITGHTFGDKALPGTIRGDYTSDIGLATWVRGRAGRNLIHASGNKEEAEFERKLWFKEKEIFDY